MIRHPPSSPLFPSTTLFRSHAPLCPPYGTVPAGNVQPPPARPGIVAPFGDRRIDETPVGRKLHRHAPCYLSVGAGWSGPVRSEEHTSELQSRLHLVCRLLLA